MTDFYSENSRGSKQISSLEKYYWSFNMENSLSMRNILIFFFKTLCLTKIIGTKSCTRILIWPISDNLTIFWKIINLSWALQFNWLFLKSKINFQNCKSILISACNYSMTPVYKILQTGFFPLSLDKGIISLWEYSSVCLLADKMRKKYEKSWLNSLSSCLHYKIPS